MQVAKCMRASVAEMEHERGDAGCIVHASKCGCDGA